MMFEYLIQKAFDEVFTIVKSATKQSKKKLLVSKADFERSIVNHTKYVSNWSSEISFRDLQTAKDLEESYVDLNLYITPQSTSLIGSRSILPLEGVISAKNKN